MNKRNWQGHMGTLVGLLGAICATAIGTAADTPAPPSLTQPPSQTNRQAAERFVYEAALAGLQEMHLSELALRKTQDSEIRNFAQMMVTDHTLINLQLREVAQRKGIRLPVPDLLTRPERTRIDPALAEDKNARKLDFDAITQGDPNRARPEVAENKSKSDQTPPEAAGAVREEAVEDRSAQNIVRRFEAAEGPEFDKLYVRQMIRDHQQAVQKFAKAADSLEDAELKELAAQTLPKLREHQQQILKLAQAKGIYEIDTKALPPETIQKVK